MDRRSAPRFFDAAIQGICLLGKPRSEIRVLDFGCGAGELVGDLIALGYDAQGCDIAGPWTVTPVVAAERIGTIQTVPYRLPYADECFDVIVSTSVLEHAINKDECFREMRRVLKPGGYTLHTFPSKWYLPVEPHIFVPLANWLWPHIPDWWLALWALLGIRNNFQRNKPWREVAALNRAFCLRGVSYWTNRSIKRSALLAFGSYSKPMRFFIERGDGGVARLCRRLPFKSLTGWLVGQFRMAFIVTRREDYFAAQPALPERDSLT